MSRRRIAARRALEIMQNLPSDCSDDDGSDSEIIDPAVNTALASVPSIESDESDSDEEDDDQVTHSVVQGQGVPGMIQGRDGSRWQKIGVSSAAQGRLQSQNILRFQPGPTSYSTRRVDSDSPVSSFRILFDEPMLRNIKKCTVEEGRRQTGDQTWDVTLHELDQFIGLVVARGVIGGRNFPLKSLWGKSWGCQMFSQTMSRDRFVEIMRFLRFDLKTERRRNLLHDKFALASQLWNSFISNCQKAFIPQWNITVDEQLLPCKARCKFIQYMANKPDKFGLKFWLAVDVENKYLFNGFPYVGKDDTRSSDLSVPTDVVLKLMAQLSQQGYNVTCDNYFTSLGLALKLAEKKCSLVGTLRQNRRDVPEECKKKKELHETEVFRYEGQTAITLTSYQCKAAKNVAVLSSLHPDILLSRNENPKKKPDSVLYYNKTKVGVDVYDQMTRLYSVKAASRRWPVHVFYNVVDMALINSWIIYKQVCQSSISRREFIQRVAEELTGSATKVSCKRSANKDCSPNDANAGPIVKRRLTCSTSKCRNRTTDMCQACNKPVCGRCATKKCKLCA